MLTILNLSRRPISPPSYTYFIFGFSLSLHNANVYKNADLGRRDKHLIKEDLNGF